MFLKNLLHLFWLPLAFIAFNIMYLAYPWIQKDNPLEEAIENIIEQQTGFEVDLSPEIKTTVYKPAFRRSRWRRKIA